MNIRALIIILFLSSLGNLSAMHIMPQITKSQIKNVTETQEILGERSIRTYSADLRGPSRGKITCILIRIGTRDNIDCKLTFTKPTGERVQQPIDKNHYQLLQRIYRDQQAQK